MLALTKRILVILLGWSFIFLGIVGLFLPFLQGILFMIIGLVLLSKESRYARNLMIRLKEKHPKPFEVALDWGNRITNRYHRWFSR